MQKINKNLFLSTILVFPGVFNAANALMLTNDALSVEIREDNGAIGGVTFGGADWFNPGVAVSDFGMQSGTDTDTFRINSPRGETATEISTSSVTSSGGAVTSSHNYNASGGNVNLTRTYSLMSGLNVLKVESTFTNAGSDMDLRAFETFDPDPGESFEGGNSSTFMDVVSLSGAQVAEAWIDETPLAVVVGGSDYSAAASGSPNRIASGTDLNEFLAFPVDGGGLFLVDEGMHIGKEMFLANGSSVSLSYYMSFGTTLSSAEDGFVSANTDQGKVDVPEPAVVWLFSFGLLGMWIQKRKSN